MMERMNIVFPFAVCQDIVKNAESQLCHVYRTSISFNGTKTHGSLQARVVPSETEKMIEFVVSLSYTSAESHSESANLLCGIEALHKIFESESGSRSQTESERCNTHSQTVPAGKENYKNSVTREVGNRASRSVEKSSQNGEHAKLQKSGWTETSTEKGVTEEADADTNWQLQVSSDISNSNTDHGYSLLVFGNGERKQEKEPPACLQQVSHSQKKGTKKYDELIKKLKKTLAATPENMTLAHFNRTGLLPVNIHHSPSDSSTSALDLEESELLTESENLQSTNSLELNVNTSYAKKEGITTEEPELQKVNASTHKRFVRKYDRLIKNLEMASERSGLEMLSVLSGHSYKLDHDARCGRMETDSGASIDGKAAKGCTSSFKEGQTEECAVSSSSPSRSHGWSTQLKNPTDNSLISDEINNSKAISSRGNVKAGVTCNLTPQPATLQTLSHLTSFPQKFPSSLIRTNLLDVFTAKAQSAHLKKRPLAGIGLTAGETVNKCRKNDNVKKMSSSVCEPCTEVTGDMTGYAGKLQMCSQEVQGSKDNTWTASQSSGMTAGTGHDHSASGKPLVKEPGSVDQKTQSQMCTRLSSSFFLPAASASAARNTSQSGSTLLMGPFQLLGDSAVVPGNASERPVLLVTGHQPTTASALCTSRPRSGEPPRIDHDYTDQVYDKNAPSSRALKTLVKPISLSQHINARVERVEEGEGSSLVTISGHNRKAAGGIPQLGPLHTSALDISKEGMPVVETLEDALTDSIRCRQRLLDSYNLALGVQPCHPVCVAAREIPVVAEMVITQSRCQQSLIYRRHKPRRSIRQQPYHISSLQEVDDAESTSLLAEGDSSQRGAWTISNVVKAEKEEANVSLSQEHCDQVFIGSRFFPGEEIVVESQNCSLSEVDMVVNNQNGGTSVSLALRNAKDSTQGSDSRKNGSSTRQDVVIENEREAVMTEQQCVSKTVCAYCLHMFHSPIMLYKHVKTVHTAYADTCPHYSNYLQGLKRDSQVLCPLCPEPCVLSNHYHLRTHLVTCHGRHLADLPQYTCTLSSPSLCDVCQIYFHTVSELKAHATMLHSAEVTGCPHCSLVFVREDNRARHMSVVHADNSACPFVCSVCHTAFHTRHLLRWHKQGHKSGSRRQNSERIHVDTSLSKARLCKAKRRTCHCKASSSHHFLHSELGDVTPQTGHHHHVHCSPLPFHCPFCGQGYLSLTSMTDHLHTHLPPSTPSGLQCPFCDHKVSQRKASLMVQHLVKQHQNRFPFSCGACCQSFALDGSLQVHVSQAHLVQVDGSSSGVTSPTGIENVGSCNECDDVECLEIPVTSSSPSVMMADQNSAFTTLISSEMSDHISKVLSDQNSLVVTDDNSSLVTDMNSSLVTYMNSSLVTDGNSSLVTDNSSVLTKNNSSVLTDINSSVVGDENSSVFADHNSSVLTHNTSFLIDSSAEALTVEGCAESVLSGLPAKVLSHIQLLTGQGMQAVVTIHKKDKGVQRITVSPSQIPPTAKLDSDVQFLPTANFYSNGEFLPASKFDSIMLKPLSSISFSDFSGLLNPVSPLISFSSTLSMIARDQCSEKSSESDKTGKAFTEEQTLSEQLGVCVNLSSETGTSEREDTNKASRSMHATWDVAGAHQRSSEIVRNLDERSIIVVDCGGSRGVPVAGFHDGSTPKMLEQSAILYEVEGGMQEGEDRLMCSTEDIEVSVAGEVSVVEVVEEVSLEVSAGLIGGGVGNDRK